MRGGRAVALYYVRYGSFWQDLISTGIWVTQVGRTPAGLGSPLGGGDGCKAPGCLGAKQGWPPPLRSQA